jgi:hypothetical protein
VTDPVTDIDSSVGSLRQDRDARGVQTRDARGSQTRDARGVQTFIAHHQKPQALNPAVQTFIAHYHE